jgi:hypothetical protein
LMRSFGLEDAAPPAREAQQRHKHRFPVPLQLGGQALRDACVDGVGVRGSRSWA